MFLYFFFFCERKSPRSFVKSAIERLIGQLAARSRGVTFIGINYISGDTDFTSLERRAELLLLSRDGGSNLLAFQTNVLSAACVPVGRYYFLG